MKFVHIYRYLILQEGRVEKENALRGTGISVTVFASISTAFGFFPSVMFGICFTILTIHIELQCAGS